MEWLFWAFAIALILHLAYCIFYYGKSEGKHVGRSEGIEHGRIEGFEQGWKCRHCGKPIPDYIIKYRKPEWFRGTSASITNCGEPQDRNWDAFFPSREEAMVHEKMDELLRLNEELHRTNR